MSHRQTAFNQRTDEPLITRREKVVYIANPFFRSYSQDAYGVQKQVIAGLLRLLLPQPAVMTANVPSTAQVTVLEQGPRCIVHVLYYPLTRRAPDIDIIEEAGSLENVVLKLRCHGKPARVALVPENRELPFEYTYGYAACTVPRVVGHQAVVFE